MLFNMLYRWARRYRQVDDLLIGIHPSMRHFYGSVLLFKRIGATRSYQALNSALSVPMALDIAGVQSRFHRLYGDRIIDQASELSFYDLFCAPSNRFDFSSHPDFKEMQMAGSPLGHGDVHTIIRDLAKREGALGESEARLLKQHFPHLDLKGLSTQSELSHVC